MSSRPTFIDEELLKRPLPELIPPKLSPTQNPPYSESIRNKIAEKKCHPLIESALHLMNDDLFSAHFLLRKMQEDEWGKWLHACLHAAAAEGDLEKNAKLWYEQVDPSLLSKYWGSPDPASKTSDYLTRLQEYLRSKSTKSGDSQEGIELRQIKWKELVAILEELENKFGWEETDGLSHYTEDKDPSHKSNVLGEGWRPDSRFAMNKRKK
ncbi:hypothetical protein P389DRAFT_51659 [Cystobasidium minutum MCA 4210]|uniref:uncharacterized protein n=1 Tax=Cystobasidium minutum MCA 4210 TaxID=1397322 RepID=UPI0034CD518D|eukprot:jgi/Rhomi1/51659/CE51658_125